MTRFFRVLAISIPLLTIGHCALSQSIVKGFLYDTAARMVLSNATVKLEKSSDTSNKKFVLSDARGAFSFTDVERTNYQLTISSIGYKTIVINIQVKDATQNLGRISMTKEATQLKDITIQAAPPTATQKGDTIQYPASSFKVNPDATAEDLIKKMPGITVDKSGTVTAQGEQLKKVTIDGRDFFGDDATAALRNLPSEIIDKIQVFDRLSEQAQFTGFDDGNSQKAMNIITKSNMRNGQFGRLYAGYGTDDRYSAGGNVSFFKKNRRISLIGMFNNVNQQNFSSQDLLGISANTGNRGGFGGGGGGRGAGRGGGGGNNANNFLVGQQSGISNTHSFGINYSDQWGKKFTITGSYFFNNTRNTNQQITSRQYFSSNDTTQYYDENSISTSDNYNHRINLRMEYKFDSSNSILITPSINFQNNKSRSNFSGTNYYNNNGLISESDNSSSRNISGYNISNSILYRHSFKKRGRTISLNLTTGFNDKTGTSYQDAINTYYKLVNFNDSLKQFSDQSTSGYQLSANLAYTEPIGKKGQLQLNYNPSYNKNKADQQTFNYDYAGNKYSDFDTVLSNKFDNNVTTHNAGATYRMGDRDRMFAVGLSYQTTKLNNQQVFPYVTTVNKPFSNWLPNAMLIYKLSSKSRIRIFYRASTNVPSISQLQNVINNSNTLQLSTGNPNLKQQLSNVLSTRYTFTNTIKGQSFFANIFLQTTNDYISNATYIAQRDSVLASGITLYKGSQLTKPVNVNGYLSMRSFFTYAMPVKKLKSSINLNAGFTYSKTPGLVNNVENLSNNYTYNAGIVIASNVSEYIDFTISYSANFNDVKNSIQLQSNNHYFNQVAGIQLNLLSKKGWFLQNDVNNQKYTGLSGGFNQDFWLWNAAIGKKFLKNHAGELKLSVFDLLKQNQSITRNATEIYIEDVQNKVLQQYFMLTFSYKIKNFGVPGNNRPNRMN
jgi:outer membrane receptor protein involved in Fe transport